MNFAKFLRTPCFRAPPVAASDNFHTKVATAPHFPELVVQSIKTTSIQKDYRAIRYYLKIHLKDLTN